MIVVENNIKYREKSNSIISHALELYMNKVLFDQTVFAKPL